LTPDELHNILLEENYEVDFLISKAELMDDRLDLYFALRKFSTGDLRESWKLKAHGHRDSRITLGDAAGMLVEEDHPLLWKFTDIQCELYFNGKPARVEYLVVDLYKIEIHLFQNYQTFGTFMNRGDIFKLLETSQGLLARGPKKLLSKYAECLKKHGIDPSIIAERPPVYPNSGSQNTGTTQLKILFLSLNYGYIIAENFAFIPQ
jgi:hypothetical protein